MRNDDERDGPSGDREDESLGAALEASLQEGLRSLSDGLANLVGEDSGGSAPPGRSLRPRPAAERRRANRDRREKTERERQRHPRESEAKECLIDTRSADDEFVVVADLFGAGVDDVTAGINPRTDELVVSKAGAVVGRVDLPWPSPEVEHTWFKNGVLEVHMRPDDSDSGEDSSS